MTQRPDNLKRIRLELARSKEYPKDQPLAATSSLPRSMAMRTSTPYSGANAATGAASAVSGMKKPRSGIWCTGPAAQSMRSGFSTMMADRRNTTTRPAIVSARTRFALANTFPSATLIQVCTPFV